MQSQSRNREKRVLDLASKLVSLLEAHGEGSEASTALAIARSLFSLRFSDRCQDPEATQTGVSTQSESVATTS
jgi:hypothetical protein